ncbi:hypothetical protein C922_03760 [Plasmodium inui San Antonio 1]|uniref:SBDS family rRNA metabolism protein n=1 Tax=Plasmodium inui San Antonio 1 TaxID=1237626 RepID=W6ZY66_9APIC|nr:hypothetical protein C922_03760 [Plasmodium inui San Antonio 1]EUD65777.1 hypothetical protein C922_03760 [Plasmodium inui San Antonio 1]
MGALFQPINQVKFTNVAIVKYKHKGKKFEIACYKNKIIDWKNGIELNIDDVLQSHLIFTNVSKGEIAKKSELNSCFNSDNNYEICKTILEKGTLQISNKERSIMKEKIYKDMIEILHEMSVNPQTGYPLSTNMIESLVKNIGYSINMDDSAKKQALKVFDILSKEYDDVIQRAFMRIQIICDDYIKDDVIKFLNSNNAIIEEQKLTNNVKREDNVDPKSSHVHDEFAHLPKNEEGENGMYAINTGENENDAVIEPAKEEFGENAKVMSDSIAADSAGKNAREQDEEKEKEEKYSNKNVGGHNASSRECCNNDAGSTHLRSDHKDTPVEDSSTPKSNKGEHEDNAEHETNHETGENYTHEKEKSESISKKEINDLLHSTFNEEKQKQNTKGEICRRKDEKIEIDPINLDVKLKTKQKKNKNEKERKEKNLGMHRIVFLCYPCVYRCVDAFTKKYKKNCSSKLLNNNVKIVTSNKKRRSNAENSMTGEKVNVNEAMGRTVKSKDNRQMGGDNLNGGTSSKGNRRRDNAKGNSCREEQANHDAENAKNAGDVRSDHPHQANKSTNRNDNDKVIDDNVNNNSCNNSKHEDAPNAAQQKSKEEPSDKPNNENVIMCTSCLTKIEKSNYKLHCRSDFHVYNVKRKYKKLAPITLEEYVEIDFDVAHFHVDM